MNIQTHKRSLILFSRIFPHQADKDFHWNFQYDYDYDYEWNYVYNDGGWTYGNGDCVLVSACLYLFIIDYHDCMFHSLALVSFTS